MTRRFALGPHHRLRKRREYLLVYGEGQRFAGSLLVLFVRPAAEGSARLGVTATRKVGSAVRRNRARRVVRELFRRHRERMGPWELVVNVRAATAAMSYEEVERDFVGLIDRVRRRFGPTAERDR